MKRARARLMQRKATGRGTAAWALLVAFLAAGAGAADLRVENYELQPGWNSIWLGVDPVNRDPAAVFSNLPLISVWTYVPQELAADYIQNPAEGLWNQPGWLSFFPTNLPIYADLPGHFPRTLWAMYVNRPYLVHVDGSSPVTLSVTGRPSYRPPNWTPDSFSLVGLPVHESAPPTFDLFFSASTAHQEEVTYRLNATGVWEMVDTSAQGPERGVSYWVSTEGGSEYPGPLELDLQAGDGIDFEKSLETYTITLKNLLNGNTTVTLSLLPATDPVPLTYRVLDTQSMNYVYVDFPAALNIPLAAGELHVLRLGLRRERIATPTVASTLEITTSDGVKILLPVEAIREDEGLSPATAGRTARAPKSAAPPSGSSHAGLWLGAAEVQQVADFSHINKDLSFDLEVIGVVDQHTLIPKGADWRYNDTGASLPFALGGVLTEVVTNGLIITTNTVIITNWVDRAYDDTSWPVGDAQFGFGDGDEATVVSYGPDPTNKFITTYFRKDFVIGAPSMYSSLELKLLRDDGAVVYLNGAKMLAANMPVGSIDYRTPALSEVIDSLETNYYFYALPPSALLAGTNVLAIEVHLANAQSPDMSFDLELKGLIADPLNSVLLPAKSVWRVNDSGGAPSNWMNTAYNDSAWWSGRAELGFGDGGEGSVTSGATNGTMIVTMTRTTYYFRTTFVVPTLAPYAGMNIRLLRDDGAVVYVNGQEVVRDNMPTGPIGPGTFPLSVVGGEDEFMFNLHGGLPLSHFVEGTNVVAVEVHQSWAEVQPSNPGIPAPVSGGYPLRLVLHVDGNGQTRLLKDVIQMWKEGGYLPDPEHPGFVIADTNDPSYFVLLTDDTLVPQYNGVTMQDGEMIGRRISTVSFEFDGEYLDMTGTFGIGGNVASTIEVPPAFPTNPYRHKYHPDHNNLDEQGQPLPAGQEEAYAITRDVSLTFTDYDTFAAPGVTNRPLGWGQTRMGGIYSETITGVHKLPIVVEGAFKLQRISLVDTLNDGGP